MNNRVLAVGLTLSGVVFLSAILFKSQTLKAFDMKEIWLKTGEATLHSRELVKKARDASDGIKHREEFHARRLWGKQRWKDLLKNLGTEPHMAVSEQEWSPLWYVPMDEVWSELGTNGMNFAHVVNHGSDLSNAFSERSNPYSHNYQAWIGGYGVHENIEQFLERDKVDIAKGLELFYWDMIYWQIWAGDPNPKAEIRLIRELDVEVDGVMRTVYEFEVHCHSDLTVIDTNATRLTKLMGMPPGSVWEAQFNARHDIVLRGYYGGWRNPVDERQLRFVYAVAAQFKDNNGKAIDYYTPSKEYLLSIVKSLKEQPIDL